MLKTGALVNTVTHMSHHISMTKIILQYFIQKCMMIYWFFNNTRLKLVLLSTQLLICVTEFHWQKIFFSLLYKNVWWFIEFLNNTPLKLALLSTQFLICVTEFHWQKLFFSLLHKNVWWFIEDLNNTRLKLVLLSSQHSYLYVSPHFINKNYSIVFYIKMCEDLLIF